MNDMENSDQLLEQQVIDYLEEHEDFFRNNPQLLLSLAIPHHSGEGTISLLERQNSLFRQQIDAGRQQLDELINVARENDALNRRLHKMILTLLERSDFDSLLDTLLDDLRQEFQADAVELKLFSSDELEQAVNEGKPGPLLFEDFITKRKPKCGILKQDQMQYLFGSMASETGSVALIPIHHQHTEGVLAIGSHDDQRFHPGKDTEFLQRLGELISTALARFSTPEYQ